MNQPDKDRTTTPPNGLTVKLRLRYFVVEYLGEQTIAEYLPSNVFLLPGDENTHTIDEFDKIICEVITKSK